MTQMIETSAPGRVNLIGEHTDYNGGFVLPCAIPQRTRIRLTPRTDQLVSITTSAKLEEAHSKHEFKLGQEKKTGTWVDYIQGVVCAVREDGLKLQGFDALVESDVPVGSGLSSSAALEVSLMRALREAFKLELTDVRIAQLGQKAENEFVGARVGIMDQMASSLAGEGAALFLDTRDLSYRQVPLPKNVELVVISSGISHRNAGGDYNTRRSECEKACELLGIKELRDLGIAELWRTEKLPEVLRRRAKHVITENERVLKSVRALENGNAVELGSLFVESHASMRDDYEVSIPEIDLLVDITRDQPGCLGARLTGGGFGGSIVALAAQGRGRKIAQDAAKAYAARTGETPRILVP